MFMSEAFDSLTPQLLNGYSLDRVSVDTAPIPESGIWDPQCLDTKWKVRSGCPNQCFVPSSTYLLRIKKKWGNEKAEIDRD
jgi:hypothetical protein